MDAKNMLYAKGKVVYFINGVSFENSKDKRDGKEKAIQYCYDNFLNPNEIIKFDSRTERNYYLYLCSLKEKGLISNLMHHYTIQILPSYVNANGDLVDPLTYEADFVYYDEREHKRKVVDIKGSEYFINDEFLNKKKIFDYVFKSKELYISVIMYKNNEWVEWKVGENKKSQKLIKKQRTQIQTLKKTLHDKEIEENKIKRYKKRYDELLAKTKLTKAERTRLNQLKELLHL